MNQAMQKRPAAGGLSEMLASPKVKAELSRLCGQHLNADRLLSLALLSAKKSKALMACSTTSIVKSVMDAARLGLELDGVQAALVPFKGEAQCMPMYQGLTLLAYEDPTLESLDVYTVREGDEYEIHLGTNARIIHRPMALPVFDDNGELSDELAPAILYYSIARLRGAVSFEVMTLAEIERIRKRSPSVKRGQSSPWDTDYDEMAKKTVLKRHLKRLPRRPRLSMAVGHDNALESGELIDMNEDGEVASVSATVTKPKGLPRARTAAQQENILSHLKRIGLQEEQYAGTIERLAGRPITKAAPLTYEEAESVIDALHQEPSDPVALAGGDVGIDDVDPPAEEGG